VIVEVKAIACELPAIRAVPLAAEAWSNSMTRSSPPV
jgi:hypothetical protein